MATPSRGLYGGRGSQKPVKVHTTFYADPDVLVEIEEFTSARGLNFSEGLRRALALGAEELWRADPTT